MVEFFEPLVMLLATVIEIGAAIIVGMGAVEAALHVIRQAAGHRMSHAAKEMIRLEFGKWLALALEFTLAADILRTAIAPTWEEIGQLAAIVILRTVLNYFLQREIDSAESRRVNERPATSG
jgi:uncharacterized membrane protein